MKTPKIYLATPKDYHKFSFFKENRSASHAKKVGESIEEIDLLRWSPILVDEEFRVIDGQGRFIAATTANRNFYYIVYDGEVNPIMVMMQLNSPTTPWNVNNYIHTMSEQGNKSYQEFKSCMDATKLQAGTILRAKYPSIKNVKKHLKNNELKWNSKLTAEVIKLNELFNVYKTHTRSPGRAGVVLKTLSLVSKQVPHADLLKALTKWGHKYIGEVSTIPTCYEMVINVFNFGKRTKVDFKRYDDRSLN